LNFLSISPQAQDFLRQEISRRKTSVFLNFIGGVATAILEITGIGLVFPLITVIMRPNAIDASPMAKSLLAYLNVTTQKELTLLLAIAIAVTMAVKTFYMIGFYKWQFRTITKWKSEFSRRMMRLYVMSDFKLHMEKTPSEMIRNLSLTGIVYDQYIIAMLNVVVNGIVVIGIAGLLFVSLPLETLFSVGIMALACAVIYKSSKNRFAAIGEENNEIYRLRNICLNQSIGAIRESKILGKERYFLDAFTALEHRTFDRQGYYNFLASLPGLIMETVIIISMLAVVANVVFVLNGGVESLSVVGLLAAAMFRLLPLALRMMSNMQLMHLGKPSLELVAAEIAVCEPRVHETFVEKDERISNWKTIELREVGYTYPNGTVAIQNLSATIERNKFVGITGPSGSGKSTLMMILLGLVQPTEGAVLIDGVPLIDPDFVRRWQNGIGYVPQGLFVIDGSIADNVAFGDDNPDLEKVRASVIAAQLGDHLAVQPNGVKESVGEYGSLLSGGQKQRLVIARALYRDPNLIAFDEATAALDVQIERGLTDYLIGYKSQKSILAIAHRISTIKHCDRILFLEKGQLTGYANFEDLKASNLSFAKLASLSNL
jgi:ABC-type multidrug transport system fused ATPase/permease subunit